MKRNWLKEPLFWILFYLVGLPLLLVLYVAWCFYVDYRYSEGFEKITPGDSEQRVIALMGRPGKNTMKLKPSDTWDGEPLTNVGLSPTARAVKYYWYTPGLFAQSYYIGFDDIGMAVSKYHYSSP